MSAIMRNGVLYCGTAPVISADNIKVDYNPSNTTDQTSKASATVALNRAMKCMTDVENGATASKAYASGDIFIRYGLVYEVISAITSGGNIVDSGVDANCRLSDGNVTDYYYDKILGEFATNENGNTKFSKSYGAGEYLIYNNELYKTTGSVGTSDDISGNSNITQTTVGTELARLNTGLSNIVGDMAITVTSPLPVGHAEVPQGSYVLYNGLLYYVTQTIRAEDHLVVTNNRNNTTGNNGNIFLTTAGAELALANSSIASLNSKVDVVKTGTVTMNVTGRSNLLVKQVGHIVAIFGYVEEMSLTANTYTQIATISGVPFPANTVRIRGAIGTNAYSVGSDAYIAIGLAGELSVSPSANGSIIYFNAVYIA